MYSQASQVHETLSQKEYKSQGQGNGSVAPGLPPEFVPLNLFPVTDAVEGENWLPLVVPLVPLQMLNNHMTVPLQINN